MQTFLPYPSFKRSVRCLDYRRLGKQRVEAKQLINALEGQESRWRNHPAAKMWEGYVDALKAYHDKCVKEWKRRGYNNTMPLFSVKDYKLPPWFGDKGFHASHRSNLLRKDPKHYGQFGWKEPTDMPYIWPVGPAKRKSLKRALGLKPIRKQDLDGNHLLPRAKRGRKSANG